MPVQITDQFCEGTSAFSGKGVCEDTLAIIGDTINGAAWVLDGATNLGRNYIPGVESDAAWYAQTLSDALKNVSLQPSDLKVIFKNALQSVIAKFEKLVDRATLPLYAQPSAAGVWLRWQMREKGHQFDCASLGDCRAIVKKNGQPTQLIGPSADIFSDIKRNEEIKKLRDVNNLKTADNIFEFFLPHNRTARATMNMEGGYRIFSIHPNAADYLDEKHFTLDESAHILLMSDGLFRLIDVLPVHDIDQLIDIAIHQGIETLYKELRALEYADPDCHQYPRTKAYDDVSAILLEVTI